ncbi:MAG: DUF624 domain-containing protein [Lachnospiraceae bacterium]|nr:DUF624 domain-containing protein [Lachnospiraceae bacterium]
MPGKIFDFDGPLFRFLNTLANIVILSVLTLVCSVPLITFGPSMKALYACSLKMVRNEEGYVTKDFFRNFKTQFLRSSVLGIFFLLAAGFLAGGIYTFVMIGKAFPVIMIVAWGIAGFIVLCTMLWIFPMQARFVNPIKQTVKLSFWLAVTKFPQTMLMLLIWLFIPGCVLFISGNFIPLVFLAELGTAAYFSAEVYDSLFAELEEKIREGQNNHREEN